MSEFLETVRVFGEQVLYTILNVRFFDILDIAIIAFIIYKAVAFLRETRAGQLIKGVVLILLLYAFSNIFDLVVLKWLLSAIIGSAIVAIAIIFQPELRRILERMGQSKIMYGQSANEEMTAELDAVDKICKAAGHMQKSKTGALIVFERKTQLGEIINTGTVIDAKASVSIINNIFYPKSPLHDGAVIIRDGRVYAAACILPLTQSNAFSSQLGTRHRAAIGMTENSDAIVLIVSEETGVISIAYNGEISRNHSVASAYTEIKAKLIDEYTEEKESVIKQVANRFFGKSKLKKDKATDEKKGDDSNEI